MWNNDMMCRCWKCGGEIGVGEDDGMVYPTNPPKFAHKDCKDTREALRTDNAQLKEENAKLLARLQENSKKNKEIK